MLAGALAAASPARAAPYRDPILADLAAIGTVRGAYRRGVQYRARDIVTFGGTRLFAWKDGAVAGNGFEPLPILGAETVAFDEGFDRGQGPFRTGRPLGPRLRWLLTGAGLGNAVLGSGYLTSAGNTYFVVEGLEPRISEFGSSVRLESEDAVATMALQRNGFGAMWHVNWYPRGAGDATYWLDGRAGQFPAFRYAWNSGARLSTGVDHDLVLRIRGNFMFGYLDGALVFIQLSDLIGTLAGQASAVYIQNHAAEPGVERQRRVWVKLRQ